MGILTPIFDADVLVLDDVGLERPTEWVQETLGVLIDKRYSNQKPTILTGNLNDDSSGKDFVDSVQFRLGPRTRSRLLEMCRWVFIESYDTRELKFTPPTRKSGSGTSARNSSRTSVRQAERDGQSETSRRRRRGAQMDRREGRLVSTLGLYLHIPFCAAICNYCNFNRGLLDEGLKTRYVDALTAKSKRPPSPEPWSTRSISAVARRRC